MARDADGDYYYDEGTLNEQLDDFGVYEKDGQVHFHHKPNDNVVKVSDLAAILGDKRGAPTTDELAQGEFALFVSDGSGVGTDETVYIARNNAGTIEFASLAINADFDDLIA